MLQSFNFFEYFFELIFEAKRLMKPISNKVVPQGVASKPIVRTRPVNAFRKYAGAASSRYRYREMKMLQ